MAKKEEKKEEKKEKKEYSIVNKDEFFGKVEEYVNGLLEEDKDESIGFFGLFKNFLNKLFKNNDKWIIDDDIKNDITNLIRLLKNTNI